MFEIDGKTKHLGIIGYPVEHSFSPQMHNYISQKAGNNYVYSAYCVQKGHLKEAIDGIKALGFSGVNVTAPYKVEVIKYLDVLSKKAKLFQSVNTVVNKDGVLYGYTTDADGFYQSLKRTGTSVKGKNILFVGAGGAAKPVAALFATEGARSITIKNRTKEHAEYFAEYLQNAVGFSAECEIGAAHYDVVINTTPVGMYPNIDAMPEFDMSLVDENSCVADMIYNPEETVFLKEAKKRGAKTLNGLGMLIYQGILSYELFTGKKFEHDIFDDVLKNVFNK